MKKNTKLLLLSILLLSFILVSFAFPVLAQDLEVQYPNIGEIQAPTTTKTLLPEYIRYIFVLSLMMAGLIAFGATVLGGLQYITSAGDPSKLNDAQDRIKSGLLGLVILLSSFLILNTINPQLVILEMPGVGIEQGIILYKNATDCNKWRGSPIPEELKDDFLKLKISHPELKKHFSDKYPGSFYSFNSNDDLRIQFYSGKDYEPNSLYFDSDKSGLTIEEKNKKNGCNDISGDTAKSVKVTWKTPGVYLYTDTGTSVVYRASSNLPDSPDQINDNVYSVKLKHSDFLNYGVILHEDADFKGKVHIIIPKKDDVTTEKDITEKNITAKDSPGEELNHEASSVTIFSPDFDAPDIASITARITLCRNPNCELENYNWNPFGDPDLKEAKIDFSIGERDPIFIDINNDPKKTNNGILDDGETVLSDLYDKQIVRGITNLPKKEWGDNDNNDENDKHEKIKCGTIRCPRGVSAIYIDSNAPYLVVLFDNINFKGKALVVRQTIPNLEAYDFDDKTESLMIIKVK